jgi:uncharacterized protein YbjT (DUF2867 family)
MAQILVIGGSGFIGRALSEILIQAGQSVIVPSRQRSPAAQSVKWLAADVHDPEQLRRLMSGCDVVINLVGILHGSAADFERAHVTLTEKIVQACQQSGIRRYLHMSALGAAPDGPSHYQRSKARAEAIVRASGLDWIIYRPSVVFGEGDQFLNLFARLLRYSPFLPLAGATSRFQPVWVHDVARALAEGTHRADLIGQTLSLVGPKVYTLAELARLAGNYAGTPRPIIPLPNWAARLQASLMSILPKPPLTHDNLDSLQVDNIDPAGFPKILGWPPTALETVAPDWLGMRK